MKLFLSKRNSSVDAAAIYDVDKQAFTVLKGSKVSTDIADFRGANSILKHRKDTVVDSVTIIDVTFKSASTAANFVTGRSTNGLIAWKTEDGKTLKDSLTE